ncbi:hypothetical protein VPH35_031727 [Triticum aestivum]|uniref:Uncharacterized protein n=1 Tax=Triticum aestivum TaxID=4565 RepID=A0A3B6CDQ2_WHEAT
MAGEEGSSCRRTTRSMTANERAAKEAAPAGDERAQKRRQRGTAKKKAPRPLKARNSKRKAAAAAAGIGFSELYEGARASGKKLARLPQEEVDWILAQDHGDDPAHDPPEVKALRRLSRDQWPSLEEEEKTDMYGPRAQIETQEEARRFQDWVRSEYAERGYIEVAEEYIVGRDQTRAYMDEARVEAMNSIDFSGGNEDLKRFFEKTWP